MGLRPRSKFVMKTKMRRCSKCGRKLNSLVTRCKSCHAAAGRPKM
jgi:hypothetical protein